MVERDNNNWRNRHFWNAGRMSYQDVVEKIHGARRGIHILGVKSTSCNPVDKEEIVDKKNIYIIKQTRNNCREMEIKYQTKTTRTWRASHRLQRPLVEELVSRWKRLDTPIEQLKTKLRQPKTQDYRRHHNQCKERKSNALERVRSKSKGGG